MQVKAVIVAIALGALLATAAPVAASRVPDCFGLEVTAGFMGTSGNDIMHGTSGDDVILALGGDDIIYGNGGRDRICGGDGDDRIYGGSGGDLLDGEGGNDRVYGQGGDDGYVLGGDGNDILSPGAGTITYTGTVEGGAGRDRIIIDQDGVNEIFGGPGRDTIDFRNAPVGVNVDLRYGQFLDATLTGLIGDKVSEVEVVFGSEFADYLRGNARDNRLYGFGGADHIWGYSGDDLLVGGDGDDWLAGGAGDDSLDGGDGWDACWQWEIYGVDCEN